MYTELPVLSYDEALDQVEAEMHKIGTKEFELSDFFCGSLYVRPVIVEAGDQLISKVHKVEHPYFLMSGTIEVYTEEGKQTISAPWIDITPAGTRRYARAVTRILWCTVHSTDKLTVEEVEAEVITPHTNKLLK